MPLEKQPEMKTWRPLFTGMAGGHDIDLNHLAANGMILLGRLKGADGSKLSFAADLGDSLTKSQLWFETFRPRIDDYARELGLQLLPNSEMRQPMSAPGILGVAIELLDLNDAGIGSIIWAGGFRYNFNWVDLPVFDVTGEPMARRGVSPIPGLYFLGLRRTYAVGSSLLAGVGDEAAYLVEQIAAKS
jgi:putative flavoprotein involved in K+ transport